MESMCTGVKRFGKEVYKHPENRVSLEFYKFVHLVRPLAILNSLK